MYPTAAIVGSSASFQLTQFAEALARLRTAAITATLNSLVRSPGVIVLNVWSNDSREHEPNSNDSQDQEND
jgi:hypothetical protein